MKKINMKKLTTVAAGAAIVATFSAANVNASENPFGMQELNTGYNIAMSDGTSDDMKGAEGKCGGDKAKEAKCGEGKCGDKAKVDEVTEKAKEAKCGEGKCGEKH